MPLCQKCKIVNYPEGSKCHLCNPDTTTKAEIGHRQVSKSKSGGMKHDADISPHFFTKKEKSAVISALTYYLQDATHDAGDFNAVCGLPKSSPEYKPLNSALQKIRNLRL